MKVCANESCGVEFEPKSKTQKFCTPKCCKEATNRRILKKYHEEKAIKAGRPRYCVECGSKLSRYNEDVICEICDSEKIKREYDNAIEEIIRIASRSSKKK